MSVIVQNKVAHYYGLRCTVPSLNGTFSVRRHFLYCPNYTAVSSLYKQ